MRKFLPTIRTYLEGEPLARERKNKDRAIGNLLRENYPLISALPKTYIADIVSDALSLDRAWRKVLETTPELRGSDYDEKEEVEKEWKENNLN